jgi:hypothetical protein
MAASGDERNLFSDEGDHSDGDVLAPNSEEDEVESSFYGVVKRRCVDQGGKHQQSRNIRWCFHYYSRTVYVPKFTKGLWS